MRNVQIAAITPISVLNSGFRKLRLDLVRAACHQPNPAVPLPVDGVEVRHVRQA
jgi:hypothetical protein